MSAITEPSTTLLKNTRRWRHPRCVVCGQENKNGLGMEFHLLSDGSVESDFLAPDTCEGYEDILHGGVISSIMDGAMTNCLFARGFYAVTAELNIRFRHELHLKKPIRVRAWIVRESPPVYVLESEIRQDSLVKAYATGKFMKK